MRQRVSGKTRNFACLFLSAFVVSGCFSRAPSRFSGLKPVEARALAQKLAADRDAEIQADLSSAFAQHPPRNVLILSGGDAHGAFGSGVLAGWRDSIANPRPVFDIVTGVSTGALMATYAFLGTQTDDALLRDIYLNTKDKDIFQGPISGPPDAVFDTAPLKKLISRRVNADVLRRVAAAHHQGRRLYVATVELDSGALFIWPMSRLADRAVAPDGKVGKEKLEQFQAILLAAASIPVLFPPVEINGGLHVDAGLRATLFVHRSMLGIVRKSDKANAASGALSADTTGPDKTRGNETQETMLQSPQAVAGSTAAPTTQATQTATADSTTNVMQDAAMQPTEIKNRLMQSGGAEQTAPASQPTVWVIFNGLLDTTPAVIDADVLNIGTRSLKIYIHTVELLSVREAAYIAHSHSPPFRFRWICEPAGADPDPVAPGLLEPMFDPKAMSRMYTSGKALVAGIAAWSDGAPPMEDSP